MWESIYHSFVPDRSTWFLMLGALGPLLLFYLLETRGKKRREEVESPPQEEKLLRPPGHSLALQLDNIWEELTVKLLLSIGCGMLSSLLWPMVLACLNAPQYRIWALIPLAPALALVFLTGHYLGEARTLLGKARNYRLGLRGEQAVAEALTEVASAGYRDFSQATAIFCQLIRETSCPSLTLPGCAFGKSRRWPPLCIGTRP